MRLTLVDNAPVENFLKIKRIHLKLNPFSNLFLRNKNGKHGSPNNTAKLKAYGRWAQVYHSQKTATFPKDLQPALEKNKGAKEKRSA
ncbi:MAG: hypothetical protein SFU98_06405 [Leptospiraceae bacterium]|nr:hypothetical protein [Leptospiraceae bacterium]